MRLIGMLDSPYVRRVAVSLKLMKLPFELEQLSVFQNYPQFEAINPVVKAPTLVTDDGAVLMDGNPAPFFGTGWGRLDDSMSPAAISP